MDHLRELQSRLFSTVLVFVIAAGIAYPFFDKIAALLMAPLAKDQELVYLTPGGAFSFIIKVCVYIGLVGALPVVIYHLYRFIMPAVRPVRLRVVLLYTIASMCLAIGGIIFAYLVSLPASLYFLTGFNLNHINPMLTIDAYFSFVMTYLLAGALLFQLPLVMVIINSVTPLTPGRLMSYQGKMILISFIVAAVISPTPDALNQTLLASPVVAMYQVGIVLIWAINRRKARRKHRNIKAAMPASVVTSPAPTYSTVIPDMAIGSVISQPAQSSPSFHLGGMQGVRSTSQARSHQQLPSKPVVTSLRAPSVASRARSMDMVRSTRTLPSRTVQVAAIPHRPVTKRRLSPFAHSSCGSIDGIVATRRAT